LAGAGERRLRLGDDRLRSRDDPRMIKRLEQVAALVVAAGLAIV